MNIPVEEAMDLAMGEDSQGLNDSGNRRSSLNVLILQ